LECFYQQIKYNLVGACLVIVTCMEVDSTGLVLTVRNSLSLITTAGHGSLVRKLTAVRRSSPAVSASRHLLRVHNKIARRCICVC